MFGVVNPYRLGFGGSLLRFRPRFPDRRFQGDDGYYRGYQTTAQHQIHDCTEVHTHTGLSGQSLFAGILTRKQSDEPLDKARIGNTIGHKGRTEPITQRDIPRGISDKARIQPP